VLKSLQIGKEDVGSKSEWKKYFSSSWDWMRDDYRQTVAGRVERGRFLFCLLILLLSFLWIEVGGGVRWRSRLEMAISLFTHFSSLHIPFFFILCCFISRF
jgi:hypothetical protein